MESGSKELPNQCLTAVADDLQLCKWHTEGNWIESTFAYESGLRSGRTDSHKTSPDCLPPNEHIRTRIIYIHYIHIWTWQCRSEYTSRWTESIGLKASAWVIKLYNRPLIAFALFGVHRALCVKIQPTCMYVCI